MSSLRWLVPPTWTPIHPDPMWLWPCTCSRWLVNMQLAAMIANCRKMISFTPVLLASLKVLQSDGTSGVIQPDATTFSIARPELRMLWSWLTPWDQYVYIFDFTCICCNFYGKCIGGIYQSHWSLWLYGFSFSEFIRRFAWIKSGRWPGGFGAALHGGWKTWHPTRTRNPWEPILEGEITTVI